jgi:hypothetical protein
MQSAPVKLLRKRLDIWRRNFRLLGCTSKDPILN